MGKNNVSWALDIPAPSVAAKLILVKLAEMSPDKTRVAWPSVMSLAKVLGASVRTVQRHLRGLEGAGLISTVPRRDAMAKDRQTSNAYVLNTHISAQIVTPPVTAVTSAPVTVVSPKPSSMNLKVEPRESPFDSGFLEFWLAYPRKTGKLEAQQAYILAITLTDQATILAGVARYAIEVANSELEFVRYPAKWLMWRGWEDGLDQAVSA